MLSSDNYQHEHWIRAELNELLILLCVLYIIEECHYMISIELKTEIGSGGKWKKMIVCLFTEREHWIKQHLLCITLLRTSAITPIIAAMPAATIIGSLFGAIMPQPAALFLWKISYYECHKSPWMLEFWRIQVKQTSQWYSFYKPRTLFTSPTFFFPLPRSSIHSYILSMCVRPSFFV